MLIRRVPGRLSVIAIVAGTVFSAISGSTIATTALLGSLMLPTMLARGYDPKMAMGPIMGIGGVDMLIPPSALTVLLGSLAGISISGPPDRRHRAGPDPERPVHRLYHAALLVQSGAGAGRRRWRPRPSFWERWRPFLRLRAAAALDLRSRGRRMTAGWATPTESAALGAAGTIVAAMLYRSLTSTT